MKIRPADFDDIESILRISNWAAQHTASNFAIEPETLEHWQASWTADHERCPWFVAEDDDAIVGFARSSPWKRREAYAHTAEVSVYIDADHFRQGIARSLYEHLIPQLEKLGMRTLLAGITLPNEPSVKLHESFGFVQTALLPRVGWKFEQWHDVGYWVLHVGADGDR